LLVSTVFYQTKDNLVFSSLSPCFRGILTSKLLFFFTAFSQRQFFPPHHNTPTDDHVVTLPIAHSITQNSCDENPPLHYRPRAFSAYQQHRQLMNDPASSSINVDIKPRSYSTTRDCIGDSGFLPYERITTKPRSYSFDAVGRSHQYYNDERHATSSALHHHYHRYPSSLSPSQREQSADEGIGTSEGGSADSLESSPTSTYKRKVCQVYNSFCIGNRKGIHPSGQNRQKNSL